jgi:PTS system cellobiose-specific IIA component
VKFLKIIEKGDELDKADERLILELISNSARASDLCDEALEAAKQGIFQQSDILLHQAEEAIAEAHDCQFSLLTKQAQGEDVEVNILMVHGQDHLNRATISHKFTLELCVVYKKLFKQL